MPVAIGPLETAVKVSWGAAGELVVQYHVMQNEEVVPPPIILSKVPWDKDAQINICTPDAADARSKTGNKPVVWKKEAPKIEVIDKAVNLDGVMVFHLGPLRALSPMVMIFTMTMPQAGKYKQATDTLYWLWDDTFGATTLEENMEHPFTTGDPLVGPFAIMIVPRQFFRAADRDAYLALGAANWHGANRSSTGNRFFVGEWSFRASTFKKLDSKGQPTGPPVNTLLQKSPTPEAPVPPMTFEIGVEYKSLKIIAVQQ